MILVQKEKALKMNNLDIYLKDEKLVGCQKDLNYQFHNPNMLLEALWHSSQKNLTGFSYERMEFLGDAILRNYASIKLYHIFPQFQEGSLTKAISNIVSAKSLSSLGKKLNLDKYIFIAPQPQNQIPESILGDVFESIVAAIYLDGGINAISAFLDYSTSELFVNPLETTINYKAVLSEWAQKNKIKLPVYEVIEQFGPDHDCQFKIIIRIDDKTFGPITDKSKKDAEQKVAHLALQSLNLLQ
jgi:ribonuclease-3